MTVSYTHLDVYKRQTEDKQGYGIPYVGTQYTDPCLLYTSGPHMGGDWGNAKAVELTTSMQTFTSSFKCTKDLEGVEWASVSYTHLDVYKRQ